MDFLYEHYPELKPIKEDIEKAIKCIVDCYRNGGLLLLCGNGGSSSDCSHIAGELMKSFTFKRRSAAFPLVDGVPCVDLTSNVALITAIANDVDPDLIFAQQVYVHGKHNPNCVLLGLTTSGNSKNVVKAFEVAKDLNLKTIVLTADFDSASSRMCDVVIKAPSRETYRAQEYHLAIYHYICAQIEENLFEREA